MKPIARGCRSRLPLRYGPRDRISLGHTRAGLLGFVLPAWGVWRWHGAWRMAAVVPAAIMAFVVLRIVVDGLRDPTSHNLFPFEILMTGLLSVEMMAMLYLAHKLFSGRH